MYSLRLKCRYNQPVSITGITGKYDAGATVRFMNANKKTLASKSCYASNGGKKNTCSLSFSKTTGTTFFLQIDSKHGTWNWMGEWKIIGDGCKTGSDLYRFSDTSSCKPTISMESDGTKVCFAIINVPGLAPIVCTAFDRDLSRACFSCCLRVALWKCDSWWPQRKPEG